MGRRRQVQVELLQPCSQLEKHARLGCRLARFWGLRGNYKQVWKPGPTLGLFGASGSSSTGLMIATRWPSLSMKKYVPPRPASTATGGCTGPTHTAAQRMRCTVMRARVWHQPCSHSHLDTRDKWKLAIDRFRRCLAQCISGICYVKHLARAQAGDDVASQPAHRHLEVCGTHNLQPPLRLQPRRTYRARCTAEQSREDLLCNAYVCLTKRNHAGQQ